MRLELFDFIDETIALIDEHSDEIQAASEDILSFLESLFGDLDYVLNISHRLKSKESLREKILRHNFYLHYGTAKNLLTRLSDLIGVRIECRFIEDEEKIYVQLLHLFTEEEEDGYFSSELNPNFWLKLDEYQPTMQKNGFELYKIDGKYFSEGESYNFELQIKSLVNVFWGEIDHRILYKNFNYMLAEDFFRDIMISIKDNLGMIDRQLMLLFDQLNSLDASNGDSGNSQLKSLISKIIHDVYVSKVKEGIGFIVDFKKTTDVIVDYLFLKDKEKDRQDLGDNFLRLFNRLAEIRDRELNFGSTIEFERNLSFHDNYTRQIGYKILSVINKDFRWNLFFKIIFDIENGDEAQDFEEFVIFLRYQFSQPIVAALENHEELTDEQKAIIKDLVLEMIIERFSKEIHVDFITEPSLTRLHAGIGRILSDVNDYEDWLAQEDRCRRWIMNHQIDQ